MNRYVLLATMISASLYPLRAESHFKPQNLAIGFHLEQRVKLSLDDFAPDEGLPITLKSADPTKLVLSKSNDKAGTGTLVISANSGTRESPYFWVQALDKSGTVDYTIEAPGFAKATGTITLAPAGITLSGPLKMAKYLTTTGATPSKITFHAVRLDANLKEVEEQQVAGGFTLNLDVTNSNEAAGKVADAHVVIPAGSSSARTTFKPSTTGDAVISAKLQPGFTLPSEYAEVTASVRKPALGLSDRLQIGQNLQIRGDVLLGEFSPDKGLDVTISSEDPSLLLISLSATEVGTKTVKINIPANGITAPFYLQGLGSAGEVKYTATAEGFRTKVATVTLSPSGVIIAPVWQGPPDEAQLFRSHTAAERNSKFMMSLAKGDPMHLIVWTARLDPVTHRCADITVQPLRAGYSIKVPVKNSNPEVGDVDSEVTIEGAFDHGMVHFKAKALGNSEISVVAPKDFTQAENSTMAIGYVQK
jgi:hypothetical protein